MKYFWICLMLLCSLFLETTILSLPVVLVSLIILAVLFKESWIFPAAFFIGILLDMLSFRTIGVSSVFFILVLGGIFLYQRKFEIQSVPFITIATLIITIIYAVSFGLGHPILIAVVSSIFAGIIFFGISLLAGGLTRKVLGQK